MSHTVTNRYIVAQPGVDRDARWHGVTHETEGYGTVRLIERTVTEVRSDHVRPRVLDKTTNDVVLAVLTAEQVPALLRSLGVAQQKSLQVTGRKGGPPE